MPFSLNLSCQCLLFKSLLTSIFEKIHEVILKLRYTNKGPGLTKSALTKKEAALDLLDGEKYYKTIIY